MKTKNILLGILSIMTFATYAQTEKSKVIETKTAVTELKVETENLDELKNFDWEMVKEMFQENDENQEIILAFAYVNKSEIDKSKVRVVNFEMKLTGKTADLDKLTARLKKSFEKLDEIDGRNIKN
jgi:actin-related protein